MSTLGVKGSDVYNTTGSTLLDLSTMLNNGLSKDIIKRELQKVFETGTQKDKIDAFVLAFQTRDIRGGKGERDLFYHIFETLLLLNPEATEATIPLIPEYGCWRDIFKLFHLTNFTSLVTNQLHQDLIANKPSLLAKHAPREHNKKDKPLASILANAMFPNEPNALKFYRKTLSKLNKRLNTVEIAMCAKNFASIDPSNVPGRALKLYTKAFLNKPVHSYYGRRAPSMDLDRITASQNFTDYFALASKGLRKVNGANTVYPHELVEKVLCNDYIDFDAIEAQWLSIVRPIKEAGIFNHTLAMCDFSGSMSGNAMHVSMALGLIIAECNTGIFKDHILTFDSTPTLHKFEATTFVGRVDEIKDLAQGVSTDFQAAYNLILSKLKDMAVCVGQEPKDLIVLTDMGWDSACGFDESGTYTNNQYKYAVNTQNVETHPQIARRDFQLAGEQLFGQGNGWLAPRIIIWNLRTELKEFHTTTLEQGILQVSGWSPSLLKVLIKKGVDAMTPQAILRAQLDDERYDPVRSAVAHYFSAD